MGRVLKFDNATSRFEHLKYAGVQVELLYDSPRPDHVWVPIINSDGEDEDLRVKFYIHRCPIPAASVRHLAIRWLDPNAEKPTPRNFEKQGKTTTQTKSSSAAGASSSGANKAKVGQASNENIHTEKETTVDFINNMEMVPYVVGSFLGCDVVMDEDEIINEINSGVHEGDDLDCFDEATQTNPDTAEPIATTNAFQSLSTIEEGECTDFAKIVSTSPRVDSKSPGRKRKKDKSPPSHPVVIALSYVTPTQTDAEGFKQVNNRKSPRVTGRSQILNRLK